MHLRLREDEGSRSGGREGKEVGGEREKGGKREGRKGEGRKGGGEREGGERGGRRKEVGGRKKD